MAAYLEQLKGRLPLLDYLRRIHWPPRCVGVSAEVLGMCPFHHETKPSFYVNVRKNLFYCHGCERGGDLIRFVELSQGLSFRQSVAYLQQQIAPAEPHNLLETAAVFYWLQLHRHSKPYSICSNVDSVIPPSSKNWASAMRRAATSIVISPLKATASTGSSTRA